MSLAPDVTDPAAREEATLAAVTTRDFSGRGAALYHALLAAGARWAASPAAALALLGTAIVEGTTLPDIHIR